MPPLYHNYTADIVAGDAAVSFTANAAYDKSVAVETQFNANYLTTGQESFHRDNIGNTSAVAPASGHMRLAYFTGRKTETITQVRMWSGATAAGLTPTLCRIGLYSIAANGDGTLVAAVDNDITLFATINTSYTRSWASSYGMVIGTRYAVGALVISVAAMPTYYGSALGAGAANGAEAALSVKLASVQSGLSDLPSSFTNAQAVGSGQRPYVVVLPA